MAIANWITLMNPKDSNEIGNNEQQKANMERWETFSQNGRYNIRDPDDLMVEYKSR